MALVKQMLGRDTVTARHLHENEFEFVPVFSLFMNTNHLPKVSDQTLFESGRVAVVEFPKHLEPHEQDRGLKDRLKRPEELSGILNWCLEGLRAYREEGADLPASVVAATRAYAESSDKLGLFLADRMEQFGGASKGGDVYDEYAEWCECSGYRREGKQSFFEALRGRGLMVGRGKVNGHDERNVVQGYRIKPKRCLP